MATYEENSAIRQQEKRENHETEIDSEYETKDYRQLKMRNRTSTYNSHRKIHQSPKTDTTERETFPDN